MSTIFGDIVTIGGKSSKLKLFALIQVIYPVGSTCTATNGKITLTAEDTSGRIVFRIPEPENNLETWVLNCTDGTNNCSKTICINTYGQIEEVTLAYIPESVNDATWEQISEISQSGTGDAYWDVGDSKAVTLNGKIGDFLTLDNVTLYVYILDFNHPIDKTTPDNNIIWGGFKTSLTGGKDVALVDSKVGNTNITYNSICFSMNYSSNIGGWKGCDFRYGIIGATSVQPTGYLNNARDNVGGDGSDATRSAIDTPVSNTLMAALQSDLRSVLRLWKRYVDYTGYKSNSNANCSTATVDAISLLAEFEIFGNRTNANTYEKNHQKQMAYYSSGNSKIKYKHNATSTACSWWVSSPNYNSDYKFCIVSTSGTSSTDDEARSSGLAPAFKT